MSVAKKLIISLLSLIVTAKLIVLACDWFYQEQPKPVFRTREQSVAYYHSRNRVHPTKMNLTELPWKACRTFNGADLQFFAYVFIRVSDFSRRQVIRETWPSRFPARLDMAFVLGTSPDATVNELVRNENKKFGDLIQGDFLESLRNLSYKSMAAWRFINEKCHRARYFLKLDDDVVVNPFYLLRFMDIRLNNPPKKSTAFLCSPWNMQLVLRDEKQKFYTTWDEYGKLFFETYCDGPAYIMTRSLVESLHRLSYTSKEFWIDDVYVGWLASQLRPQLKFVYHNRFYAKYNSRMSRSHLSSFFYIWNVTSSLDYVKVWEAIDKNENDLGAKSFKLVNKILVLVFLVFISCWFVMVCSSPSARGRRSR